MIEQAQSWLMHGDHLLLDAVVLTLLILSALVVSVMRDLLATAVMMGIFSLLMAMLYLLFDAPDVALTEAAVGGGISTLLFLCTLTFTKREKRATSRSRKLVPLVIVTLAGGALLYATDDLPGFANPNAPIHQHTTPYYLENMQEDIAIPNYVTAILGSYRGFDTLGEVAVIFTAGISIAALLMNAPQLRATQPSPPSPVAPTNTECASPSSRPTPRKKNKGDAL